MPAARGEAALDLLRIELLGGFRIAAGSRAIADSDWRLRKAAALVKLLALEPGHRLDREKARDLLWPDLEPAAAANNLRYALHVARRMLASVGSPPQFLQTDGGMLALAPAVPVWVDVSAFEVGIAAARRSRDPAAYRSALALYSGDLLPHDRFEEWTAERRRWLRNLHLAALMELAQLYQHDGDAERAIDQLQRVVAVDPTHEVAHAALMRLFARAGDRSRALRQFQHLEEVLRRELDMEPEMEIRGLYDQIRSGCPVGGEPESRAGGRERASRTNLLTPLSSFVGREQEIVAVAELLRNTRLLSLTGPGGSGKSRLALQVATDALGDSVDEVWLVELAALTDPALVPHVVAAAFGVREVAGRAIVETICEALGPRRALLVLDNCEHLVQACAVLVNALLRVCPNVTILVTSRSRLGLMGEVVWRIPPFSIDDGVRLFAERAAAVAPGFVLTEGNARPIREIVRRLDGIPLALELAAARVPSLSVEGIVDRLDDRFQLLTGGDPTALPHQQTLRATLDWSYDLLTESEQALFRRLAEFAGGFDLDAVEAIGGTGPATLDLLARLVDRSLVVVDEGGGMPRNRLAETVRQYAEERLSEDAEAPAVCARHRRYYLKLAERLEMATWGGPEQKAALDRLEREHDNLRAALMSSLSSDDAVSLMRLSAALGRFWEVRGHLTEGNQWLGTALVHASSVPSTAYAWALNAAGRIAMVSGDPRRAAAHFEESLRLLQGLESRLGCATALLGLGWATFVRGDVDGAATHYEESLALYRELDQPLGVASVLIDLGIVEYERGNHDRATALVEESLQLFGASGDRRGTAWALHELGLIALYGGDLDRARPLIEQSLTLCRDLADTSGVAAALNLLGSAARVEGDLAQATRLYREALTLHWETGDVRAMSACIENLARTAAAEGRPERALRLAAAASAQRERSGMPLSPATQHDLDCLLAVARRQAGGTAAAAWAAGRSLDLRQTVAEALGR